MKQEMCKQILLSSIDLKSKQQGIAIIMHFAVLQAYILANLGACFVFELAKLVLHKFIIA